MAVKKASSTVKTAVKKETVTEAVKVEPAKATTVKVEPAKSEEKSVSTAKAIETKKDTTKKLETKAAVLVNTPEEKAEVKKETVKKAAKKPAAKKAPAKKAELKTEIVLQYADIECTEKEVLQKVKENWTKVLKNKVGDMKDVKIYLKPEERKAYYVVNGNETGAVDL